MTETENKALYIANECRKAGMTLAGASGVLANIEAESAFIPTNVQDAYEGKVGNDAAYTAKVDNGSYGNFAGDAAGYGLCQWTASERKAQMLSYFRQRGKSIGDFKTQVDWMLHEMHQRNRSVFNLCCTSNNPHECGYQICMYYETPANTKAAAEYRGGLAEKWYNWLPFNDYVQPSLPEEPEAPSTDKKEHAWIPPDLSMSSREEDGCVVLQALLNAHGWDCGKADGFFGPKTQAAVNQAKEFYGMKTDGKCTEELWIKLGIDPAIF